MSRLSELIAELCPDGVEYKELGEVGTFMRGSSFQKKHFVGEGMPCIHYGQVHTQFDIATDYTVAYLDEEFAANMRRAKPGDLIIATTSEDDDAVGKAVAWLGESDVVVSNDAYIYRHDLEPKYMAYYFASELFQEPKRHFITGTKVRRINDKSMSRIRIPVPPIEVQREVVRILDEYTAAHDELIRRLHEEMRLCEQQLVTARNELLKFNGKVKWISLGEIAQVSSGATPPRKNGSLYSGSIPWVKTGEVARGDIAETEEHISEEALVTTSCRLYPAGTVLIAMYGQGDTRGKSAMLMTSAATNQACAALEFRDGINPLFVLKQLQARYKELRDMSNKGGGQSNLKLGIIRKFRIAIPSTEAQDRFIEKSEQFDCLGTNGLMKVLKEEALLAAQELSLVRNHLLSFPEKVS